MNKSKRNLLVLSFHTCPLGKLGTESAGGMNVYVLQLSLALEKLGFSIDIFTIDHSECTEKITNITTNIKVIHLNTVQQNISKEDLYNHVETFKRQLINYINEHNIIYDIIHSHYWLSGIIGKDLSQVLGINNVVTFHTLAEIKNQIKGQQKESQIRLEKEQEIVKSTGTIIVSTNHELEVLTNRYQIDSSKVKIIPPGVDLSLFKPKNKMNSLKQIGVGKGPIIIYVGRIDPIKGLPVLIEAMKYLNPDKQPKLLVIGDNRIQNDATDQSFELIRRYKLEKHITFIGTIEQAQLPLYYNAASLCIIPSHYESFGLVALEAMACKTTVIGTKVPGLESIIQNQYNGVLVEVNSPQKLASAIEKLLTNVDLNIQIAENGYKKSKDMTWDSFALKTSQIYENLIN